jgi:hypothetical protein
MDYLAAFTVRMTDEQMAFYKYGTVDMEPELPFSKMSHAYTRPAKPHLRTKLTELCPTCRNKPYMRRAPRIPASYAEVMKQMRRVRSALHVMLRWKVRPDDTAVVNTTEERLAYITRKKVYLEHAAYKAALRKRAGTACPIRWEHLLDDAQRQDLEALYNKVVWRKRVPSLF